MGLTAAGKGRPFDDLEDDFLRIAGMVAWCTVATVDTRGRPRSRILHPIWEVVGGTPVGWIGTTKSPLKAKHLEANPHVSCSYWAAETHESALAECGAAWADDQRERVWQMFLDAPPPVGYDPGTMPPWKDGPLGGVFSVLRLDPWRVMVQTAEDSAAGRFNQRVWRPS